MRIGVDLGGTKIEVAALDDAGGELLRRRVPTPPSYDGHDDRSDGKGKAGGDGSVIGAIRKLVLGVERELGQTGSVGIGTPGSLSPRTGLLRNSNSLALNGRPFAADIAAALGREVRTANDADCLALSEAADGAGAGQRVVFAVILGTGVGGGIVVDGQLRSGRNGLGGEWGHNALPRRPGDELDDPGVPDDGNGGRAGDDLESSPRACWCGRRGCIETYLSGPALAAGHARAHGGRLDAAALAEAAARGEPNALRSLARWNERLARSLAAVVNLLDPDVIVVGGGLSNIDSLYERVPALMAPHLFAERADAASTPVVRARHGDSSGVRGAARLWP